MQMTFEEFEQLAGRMMKMADRAAQDGNAEIEMRMAKNAAEEKVSGLEEAVARYREALDDANQHRVELRKERDAAEDKARIAESANKVLRSRDEEHAVAVKRLMRYVPCPECGAHLHKLGCPKYELAAGTCPACGFTCGHWSECKELGK